MSKDILNFINGEYVKNASGKTYEKRNPVDNSLTGTVYEAGKPEVDAAGARRLVVHVLRFLDAQAMAQSIKDRYERRLQEILEC